MRTPKRIALLILTGLAVAAAVVVARPGPSQSDARPKKLSVKVLRKKGDFALLPTRQEIDEARKAEEREVKDEIPAHVPIKIKLKNEEKVKDLKNDKWLADLEIEVRNTGTKPIYFLRLGMSFVDVRKDSGNGIGYDFVYGRMDLIDIANRAETEDVPLLPGETHVFKLHEEYVKGWNWYRTKVETKPHPKKIRVYLSVLSHGDGTGYVSTDGAPIPSKPSKKSSYEGEGKGVRPEIASAAGPPCPPNAPFELASLLVPANTLPVLFYPPETGDVLAGALPPQSCCTGQGISCAKMKLVQGGNCFCPPPLPDYGTSIQVDGFRCEDPAATCRQSRYEDTECGEGITFHTCTRVFLDPCGTLPPTPMPTPTPTPTPSPTPTPTPQPCPPPDLSDCCLCVTPAAANPDQVSEWQCGATFCNPLTPLSNGCFIPNADGSCPNGFTPASGRMCCPTTASTGSGGGGGGLSPVEGGGGEDPCTPYYWYYYESWDDGETWEVVSTSYAGCW